MLIVGVTFYFKAIDMLFGFGSRAASLLGKKQFTWFIVRAILVPIGVSGRPKYVDS